MKCVVSPAEVERFSYLSLNIALLPCFGFLSFSCNISSMIHCGSSQDQTRRRKLKIRRAVDYF